jgi:toxin YhaV
MIVNGWRLFQYPLFATQLDQLERKVTELANREPETYSRHPSAKLLATVHRYLTDTIPRDPTAAEFRQGNTLGKDNRHWFRAKFHQRFRLFFRFSSSAKIIVYAWINDDNTLRKRGAKTDVYAVFQSMLAAGNPPQTFDDLLKRAKPLERQH